MEEFNRSGSKYLRRIMGMIFVEVRDRLVSHIDVYGVIETFDVRCPARQHALKKLLCSGLRGKADTLQDLKEARDAIDRAIQMEEFRQGVEQNQ